MTTKLVFFLCFTLLSQCLLAEEIKVAVRSVTKVAETDDNFVCVTLDWWPPNKCDYNQCPWHKAGIFHLDFNNEILINAVKAFKSLRIRIGGSLQDQITYKVGGAGRHCTQLKKNKDGLFGFSQGCLHMSKWDHVNSLFSKTGALMTFGLNALIGRGQCNKNDKLWIGDWNSQNARDLMKYTVSKGYKIDSYELGNELCAGGVSARVEADQYAKDIVALKDLVTEMYPDASKRPKVLGPAGFFDKEWFTTFLKNSGPNVVDGLTHHIYNLGPGNDPNLLNRIQNPFYLSRFAQTFLDVSEVVKTHGPWSGAWVGESGGAYNSGGKDVSRTFVDGFWYLDQLGMSSTFNHKVYCRQSLIGGNYALLNTTTFIPNPDYYGALLWHRLMGKKVLGVTHDGSPYLRSYSHCSKTKPGITVLLINMSNSTTFNVTVSNDMNLYPPLTVNTQREEYHLTPKGGNIQSDELLLNGTPLKLTKTLDIPPLHPKLVDPTTPIKVAPDSIVFSTLRDFDAPACA